MKAKTALHIHIKGDPVDNISYDFKELILYAKSLNFKAIAITCHKYIFPISRAKLYGKKNGVLVISGAEIEIENKHIIILNPSKKVLQVKTFEDLKKYKSQHKRSFIIAPHPYYLTRSCLGNKLEKYIEIFDAVEFNYFYTKKINPNKKALSIARKYNKPIVGTSDCHILNTLDYTFTEVELSDNQALTEKNLFDAIKSNRINITTQPLSIWKCISILAKMLKL